jgi:transposase
MRWCVKTVLQPHPEHLPREERIYEPDESVCVQCGGFKHVGDDVSEQLEFIGAAFKVLRQVRRKRPCACCDQIVQGTAPSRPIERGVADLGLLVQIIVAKFADHQPLYRQAKIYARQGVDLDCSTMAHWVSACGALVRPLVDALQRYVLAPGKVYTDDTTMPVLAPGNGQTKTARM